MTNFTYRSYQPHANTAEAYAFAVLTIHYSYFLNVLNIVVAISSNKANRIIARKR